MGRRGIRCAGGVLAAALALTGCSSGDEPQAGPKPSPTAETPSEPPPPEPIDPCSMLTAEDLAAAGLQADRAKSVRGLAPDPRTTACMVPHRKEGWAVFYGFSMARNVSVADAIEQVGTEKPVRLDVGDRSRLVLYDAYGDKIWHAWASQGKYSVMVELFAKPRPARVERLLSRMLEQVDPAMFEFPVDLPVGCPSERTRQLRRVLGEVTTANGSVGGDEVSCTYANRGGRTVNLRVSPYANAQKVARTVGQVAQYYDERSTPARGVTLLLSPGEGYAFSGAYVTRPPSYRGADVAQSTVIGRPYRPLTYDARAFRGLAAWWATRS